MAKPANEVAAQLPTSVEQELESMQLSYFVNRSLSTVNTIVIALFENERNHFVYGWGSSVGIHLHPPVFDRYPYSDDSGNHFVPSRSGIDPIRGKLTFCCL